MIRSMSYVFLIAILFPQDIALSKTNTKTNRKLQIDFATNHSLMRVAINVSGGIL